MRSARQISERRDETIEARRECEIAQNMNVPRANDQQHAVFSEVRRTREIREDTQVALVSVGHEVGSRVKRNRRRVRQ